MCPPPKINADDVAVKNVEFAGFLSIRWYASPWGPREGYNTHTHWGTFLGPKYVLGGDKDLRAGKFPRARAEGAIKSSVCNNHRAPPVYSGVINTRGRDRNIKRGTHDEGRSCEISLIHSTINMDFDSEVNHLNMCSLFLNVFSINEWRKGSNWCSMMLPLVDSAIDYSVVGVYSKKHWMAS